MNFSNKITFNVTEERGGFLTESPFDWIFLTEMEIPCAILNQEAVHRLT